MKIDCNSPYQQNMKKKPIVISIDTEKLFDKLCIPSDKALSKLVIVGIIIKF